MLTRHLSTLTTASGEIRFCSLPSLAREAGVSLERLPYSIRILLEALLRGCDGLNVTEDDVRTLAGWRGNAVPDREVAFLPARVLLQDFTGVPAVVDLAAMREAMARLGGDPARINPLVPVDLVIDHSVQVDRFGSRDALIENLKKEFQRNSERYRFLRWGQQAFDNFRVVPPGTGIVHQVNLEYLASVVCLRDTPEGKLAFPDSLVGTDSHTTMINGLGVLGWGVGGIEAEAVMLGQPLSLLAPQVVGLRLEGRLSPGVNATDLVLAVTELLRKQNVVEKFVEFCGPGYAALALADRATIANMAPEYGATVGFCPVDGETLRYLADTGRDAALVDLVERYTKENGLFRAADAPEPEFSTLLTLDLGGIEPSLAGPKRPQDRVVLSQVAPRFREALVAPVAERGYGLPPAATANLAATPTAPLGHGSVLIASITSCTNTSNPAVMLGAALLARNAVRKGLSVPKHVKTSLAPGSQVVTGYLEEAGLLGDLETLGFHVIGYGCATCIGNSGPVAEELATAVKENNLIAAAVLSGNRNFEGRVSPTTRANYLASPLLVVAYALAGSVAVNLAEEPLGKDHSGQPVFLKDIMPDDAEIAALVAKTQHASGYRRVYRDVFKGTEAWNTLPVPEGQRYAWDPASTYVREPSFFSSLTREPAPFAAIDNARVLVMVGDSVTTDHISPAGSIAKTSPAAAYLRDHGVADADFNSYGSRRGNHEVMVRGTFANIRLKNQLLPGSEGAVTVHLPDGAESSVYEAAETYRAEGVPLIVLAGKDYGMGSSRDWAAKGVLLLGVRAVIAESYERIHRSNLIGMGILPLQYEPGTTAASLGLSGRELFTIRGLDTLAPRAVFTVEARDTDGGLKTFPVRARIETPVELEYLVQGGILPAVLRRLLGE